MGFILFLDHSYRGISKSSVKAGLDLTIQNNLYYEVQNVLVILFALSTTLVAQQPNILFIIADDMGIDAINDYGVNVMNVANTPNLDALRADGVSYMNAWSTPQCTTTRGAIMSGKYGVKSGVTNVPDNLDLDQESLFNFVQRMTNNAYADAVIGK